MTDKRSLRDYLNGPGTRGPVVRERKNQVPAGDEGPGREDSDVVTAAEENLTALGEQEAAAESENETADLDSVNVRPPAPVDPRFPDEAAPVSHSGGSID